MRRLTSPFRLQLSMCRKYNSVFSFFYCYCRRCFSSLLSCLAAFLQNLFTLSEEGQKISLRKQTRRGAFKWRQAFRVCVWKLIPLRDVFRVLERKYRSNLFLVWWRANGGKICPPKGGFKRHQILNPNFEATLSYLLKVKLVLSWSRGVAKAWHFVIQLGLL